MNSALVDFFGCENDEDENCVTKNESFNQNDDVCLNLKLPPEIESGNIEYKLKLIDPTPERFEHLVTQMKWRLEEGLGEAIYEIGVEDNGCLSGLNELDLERSLETLKQMADRLGASFTIIRERLVTETNRPNEVRKSAEILIRKVPDDQQFIELRVAVLGNAECGKSSLIGVLTHDELDNGRGKARLNLFRHLHEIKSGHTSSINDEILGFNNRGEIVNYGNCRIADEIFENSSKIITFIDLAGHHKYIKTTLFGFSSYQPDFSMLLISSNSGIAGTTREHLGLTIALDVPVFVVLNKSDLCTEKAINDILSKVNYLLKSPGCSKVPYLVNNDDDAVFAAQQMIESKICPIFTISCVTGNNLNLLKKFLNVLPPLLNNTERDKLSQELAEFRVDEIYTNQSVGNIISGMLVKGTIQEEEKLMLGPFDNGEFTRIKAKSLQRHRVPCRIIRAGQTASINLGHNMSHIADKLRKGMVLLSPKQSTCSSNDACLEFEASIYLLYHANQIKSKKFQVTVHIGSVCQTATIIYMDKESIGTNECANVKFKFHSRPEYLSIGKRFIFREGTTKGLGKITNIYPMNAVAINTSSSCSDDESAIVPSSL